LNTPGRITPLRLIIDRDENAPVAKNARLLKTRGEIVTPEKKGGSPFQGQAFRSSRAEEKNNDQEIYFYNKDVPDTPFLLSFGIPEYIVPAVPCHVTTYIVWTS